MGHGPMTWALLAAAMLAGAPSAQATTLRFEFSGRLVDISGCGDEPPGPSCGAPLGPFEGRFDLDFSRINVVEDTWGPNEVTGETVLVHFAFERGFSNLRLTSATFGEISGLEGPGRGAAQLLGVSLYENYFDLRLPGGYWLGLYDFMASPAIESDGGDGIADELARLYAGGVSEGSLVMGIDGDALYAGGPLRWTVREVPEPGTLALLSLALACVGLGRRSAGARDERTSVRGRFS